MTPDCRVMTCDRVVPSVGDPLIQVSNWLISASLTQVHSVLNDSIRRLNERCVVIPGAHDSTVWLTGDSCVFCLLLLRGLWAELVYYR